MKITDAKMCMLVKKTRQPIEEWERPALVVALEELSGFKHMSFAAVKYRLKLYFKDNLAIEDAERLNSLLKDIEYQDLDIRKLALNIYVQSGNDLKYYLDTGIAWLVLENGKNPDVYLIAKVALYFAWVGIRIEDAVKIKVSDVSQTGDEVIANGVVYSFSSGMASDIARLRDLEYYTNNTKRRGIETKSTFRIPEGEYYFRTIRSSQLSKSNLWDRIGRLNENTRPGKWFSYDKIAESGMFYRAREDEKINGSFYRVWKKERWIIDDPERAARLFGCGGEYTKQQLYFTLTMYRAYKDSVLDHM